MWIQLMCFSHESGQFVSCLELEASALPEVFEVGMGLMLGQEQWYIVEAEPSNARDFHHTKQARLSLSRTPPRRQAAHGEQRGADAASAGSPAERRAHDRYSLATLCAKLPGPDLTRSCTENTLIIHEDDWRQTEFVAPHFRHEVMQEIADVERLFEQGMIGAKMHLRDRIASPMMPMFLALDSVFGAYIGAQRYDGVGFRGSAHPIADSFALKTRQGTTLYGLASEGQVDVLALLGYDPSLKKNADFDRLCELFPPETLFVPWLLVGWTFSREEL